MKDTKKDRLEHLEDVVTLLNHYKHEGYEDWYIHGNYVESERGDPHLHLSKFTATAIVEKYSRDLLN